MRALHLFSPAHCLTDRFTPRPQPYPAGLRKHTASGGQIQDPCNLREALWALAWCVIAYMCVARFVERHIRLLATTICRYHHRFPRRRTAVHSAST